jgi:hypothetical protein
MSSRKDKGDAAERARQRYWEVLGAVVFPVSPSYPGVDLIVFRQDGVIVLSEVKGQKAKLYGKAKADILRKLRVAKGRMDEATFHSTETEAVHLRDGKWEVLG